MIFYLWVSLNESEYDKRDLNKIIAKKGGNVAGNARKDLEKKLGESVVSPLNLNIQLTIQVKCEITNKQTVK